MKHNKLSCIGVDWGSSSFRAYRFNEQFQLIESIESKTGIKAIADKEYEDCLFSHIGHWLKPGDLVLLAGMITSRNGWIETPYIPIPATRDSLIKQSMKRTVRDVNLFFLPGLSQCSPRADVLRGEELQLFGATHSTSNTLLIMPGTHSKWAHVKDGEVIAFQTIATGELFDVLLNHTLIGQLSNGHNMHMDTFKQGVQCGFDSKTIVSELFYCRSSVLLGVLTDYQIHSYLSGLLIGNEIREGLHINASNQQSIILVGSDTLCSRYQSAFEHLKLETVQAPPNTTSSAFGELLARLSTTDMN